MKSKELFFCPLECGARINSILNHISKCKNRKLLGIKYKICEYNKGHIIRNELYETHVLSCGSKKQYVEEKDESSDDDIKNKFNSNNIDINESKEENKEKGEKNIEDKKENEIVGVFKRKRRYRHEKALFQNEDEIDQECINFFNKVYI